MSDRRLLIIHLILLGVLWIIAFNTNGLGGGGDSLTHYFMASLSWSDPSYFLDLWGKPIFTLLSSPFAQFGFVGIKIFNVSCAVFASYMSCLTAKSLGKDWHWLVLPIAFVAPAYYTYTFSGLTEPLAGLIAISAVWLCLNRKVSLGFILASTLPFARTEAQIFLLFFVIFGLLNGHFKKLPLLFVSYLLFSIVGGLVFGDFAWVFSSPYNSQGSVYGSGDWFHYLRSLRGMLGWPGIVLGGMGVLYFLGKTISGKQEWRKEPWLIHGIFFSLLVGHSLVWVLGIYGSAGLERTLLTAFPFLWIIILDGLLLLKELSWRISSKASYVLPGIALMAQLIYTLRDPLALYYWSLHMTPGTEHQYFSEEVAGFIKENYPQTTQFVMDKPEMAVALDRNFINPEHRLNWSAYGYATDVPKSTLWIFDSYYVPVQYGIPLETIQKEQKLREVKSFTGPEGWTYILFEKAQ